MKKDVWKARLNMIDVMYVGTCCICVSYLVESSWNVMAHGDAQEGKWRGTRMEWVASTLHTTSEYGESSITTTDAHTPAASSRLNWWRPRRFKWTRPFRRKMKSGFCACAITFQTHYTTQAAEGMLRRQCSISLCRWKLTVQVLQIAAKNRAYCCYAKSSASV